jgi:hypothetical protein
MDTFKTHFGASGQFPNGTYYEIDKKTLPAPTTFTFLIGCFFGAFIVWYIADSSQEIDPDWRSMFPVRWYVKLKKERSRHLQTQSVYITRAVSCRG